MPLFRNNNGRLERIGEASFGLEKEIQKITEENLKEVFNLELVKSEFQLGRFRIDTLAFDPESSSFVIIEYKRGQNSGMFDQGLAYLRVLQDRKADFIAECNEKLGKNLKRQDVNENQSRIIFVSTSFNKNQIQAANHDRGVELCRICLYQDGIVEYRKIPTDDTETSMRALGSKEGVMDMTSREIRAYDEEYYFQNHADSKVKELYHEIKDRIDSLGDSIHPVFRKQYIAFKTDYNFVYLILTRNAIHIDLRLSISEARDPRGVLVEKGEDFVGLTVRDRSELPYMAGLIEQAYAKSIAARI